MSSGRPDPSEADFALMTELIEAEMRDAIDLALAEEDPLSVSDRTRMKVHQACKSVVEQAIVRGIL